MAHKITELKILTFICINQQLKFLYCAVSFQMCHFNSANHRASPSTVNDSNCMAHICAYMFTGTKKTVRAKSIFLFSSIAHYEPAKPYQSDKMNVLLTFEEREKKMDKIEIKLRRYNCQSMQQKTTTTNTHTH